MKKLIFILGIWCLGVCAVCAEKTDDKTFVLKGRIAGLGKMSNLVYTDTTGERAHLSLKEEVFQVTLPLSEPQVVEVNSWMFMKRVRGGFVPCNCGSLMFVAIPGQTLEIKGELKRDFVDLYPSGDVENDVFRKYTSAVHPLENESVNLRVRMLTDSTLTEEEKVVMQSKMRTYEEEMQRACLNFLKRYASSVGGLWLLQDMLLRSRLTMEEAEHFFNTVDKKYEGLTYYRNIAARIHGAKAAAVGQLAPSIKTARTYDGKPFDLEEYRGKYVLIDFWGTWCGACVAGMPDMKKFAKKHADKLVLLGIAKESNEKHWRDYLDESEWNWKQLIVGNGEEDYVLRYNVQGFPTKILVSPEGVILKRSVGESTEFYKELEKLIK